MSTRACSPPAIPDSLPALRFEIPEAARILRMSRAQLYNRICEGSIKPQKDGARTYITRAELERYVESCGSGAGPFGSPESDRQGGRQH
jgi:hypothetical protein